MLHKRVQAVFPASTIDFKEQFYEAGTFAIGRKPTKKAGEQFLLKINDQLEDLQSRQCGKNKADCYQHYYGVLKGPDVGGLAKTTDGLATKRFARWVSAGTLIGTSTTFDYNTPAHEIAHNLGRYHAEYCGAKDGKAFPFTATINGAVVATLGPMDKGRDSLIYGLDTYSGTAPGETWPRPVSPKAHFELMSYCGAKFDQNYFTWSSSYTYEGLWQAIWVNNLLESSLSSPSLTPLASPLTLPALSSIEVRSWQTMASPPTSVLSVRGRVDRVTDAVEFLPFTLAESAAAPELPEPGDYTLQLRDAASNVLQEISFQPDEYHRTVPVGETDLSDPTSGSFLIPIVTDSRIKQAVIVHQGTVIGVRTASPNAPQVMVISPNGDEDLSGEEVTLQWTGSDADTDALSYIVQYSPNDGMTWETLAVDWPDTSLTVPLSALAGGAQGRIRVIASDGFNSGSDQSDGVFTIGNHAPRISLLSPEDGRLVVADEVIVLRASVHDKEDGALSGDRVVWTSDIDGVLGTGNDFTAPPLSVGEHFITVTATDSEGRSTTASSRIRIVATVPEVLANLSVSQAISTDSLLVADAMAFTVTVANDGPKPATNLTFNSLITGDVASLDAIPSQGTCTVAGATVICALGDVVDGEAVTVTVVATATAPGTVTHTVSVTGTETDPALANNTDTKTITVLLDSDGDGTPDDADGCPADSAKTASGGCGCGVADTDADGDGTPNCTDTCPSDAGKTGPGLCGCGVVDADSDGDGAPDCTDACPNDPVRTAPGPEVCNGADDDCDGQVDEGIADVGTGSATGACQPKIEHCQGGSFVQTQAAVGPVAETCDGIDNDCNGVTDDGIADVETGSATGACRPQIERCQGGSFVQIQAAVDPVAETCDGIDNDCDGQVDEEVQKTFYRDADGDGFGNAALSIQVCAAPMGYVADRTDCNDNVASVHPGEPEVCNGVDDNLGVACSAGIGACQASGVRGCAANGLSTQCNAVAGTPKAEICGDGIDQDCNGADAVCTPSTYQTSGTCFSAPGHVILQPVNADGSSVFKQGSTVTAKFRVCDSAGVSVGHPGVVVDFRLVQVMQGTVTQTVNETVDSTNPDSAFRWDAVAQQWIFNISTKNLTSTQTYFYRITLDDGSFIDCHFGLKK